MSLQSPSVSYDPSSDRVAIAQRIYRERRIRDSLFQTLGNEPGWDILLDLFVAFEQERCTSCGSAAIASCAPPATAVRWVNRLRRDGFLVSEPHPDDGRIMLLSLSRAGHQKMSLLLDRVAQAQAR
ncbi:hypothetical protein [Citromicrobium bathyomarinum]|uniref:hypothetical protein n=1 Tax=Citromicrobium bathyomarinum TaxID=72174 RepID=UPI001E2A706A|nr:hypothetical protein [Citromicrobium bathyomarinum]MCD1623179.1 hypothetical protein [Citromicrobium bathyomarinum]